MELEKQHGNSNFSIVMFPWLAHGHVFPYLELAKNLSNKNFKIYFCSTAINLTSIKDSLKQKSSNYNNIELVELHLPSFPDLPPPYHTTKNVPPQLFSRLYQAFRMSKSSFWEIISTLKPDLLIYDAHQIWAAKHASSLGIPAVHFSVVGATSFAFGYHYIMHKNNPPFPYRAIYVRDYEITASQAALAHSDYNNHEEDENLGYSDPFGPSRELVLMNSYRGIEGKYIDYLSLLLQKKVVPVSTLTIHDDHQSSTNTTTADVAATDEYHHIMEWLNKKNKVSTIFISFGSENYFSKDQMEEIAKGLEICDDINFIWAIRFPAGGGDMKVSSLEEALPMGFVDKVKERGMIVEGWAPQTKILSHPSIGAFVSHCGMNSILESTYFGVPVVAIPLKLDQPFHARLLVEAGVGLEVARDDNGHLNREGFSSAIKKVVLEKFGEDMRLKAAELSKKMKSEAAAAMDEAIEHLCRLCVRGL